MRSTSTLTTSNYKILGLVTFTVVNCSILSDKCHSQSRCKIYSPVHFFIQIFIAQLLLDTYH